MKRITIALLAVLFFLGGCASTKVALYNKSVHYAATDPKDVEVFQKKPEASKFVEIGEITVDGASSWDQVERIFKIKGAEYGANAVYVLSKKEIVSNYPDAHECHFYDDFYYPHGMYMHRYHLNGYYPHYYYCYGYNDVTTSFFTVVGIAIRYTPDEAAPEAQK